MISLVPLFPKADGFLAFEYPSPGLPLFFVIGVIIYSFNNSSSDSSRDRAFTVLGDPTNQLDFLKNIYLFI